MRFVVGIFSHMLIRNFIFKRIRFDFLQITKEVSVAEMAVFAAKTVVYVTKTLVSAAKTPLKKTKENKTKTKRRNKEKKHSFFVRVSKTTFIFFVNKWPSISIPFPKKTDGSVKVDRQITQSAPCRLVLLFVFKYLYYSLQKNKAKKQSPNPCIKNIIVFFQKHNDEF